MAQAKTLNNEQLQIVMAAPSPRYLVDRAIWTLSFKAALRSCEMAGLNWRDVTDVFGQVLPPKAEWSVPPGIAKNGKGRKLFMHPDMHEALVALKAAMPKERTRANCPVVPPAYGLGRVKPNTLQRYISRRFAKVGLEGCSSHSGRRTFITTAARKANTYGASLRDVMLLAGHANMATTEKYVDLSDGAQDLMMAM